MMIGDVDDSATPEMLSFPSSVKDSLKHKVPTDTLINATRDEWPTNWPVFKFNDLKDANCEDVQIIKIASVPFFVTLDGLDEDLDAGMVLERIQSLDEFKGEEYLQHAANFLKACMVQYQTNQPKPALETMDFAAKASKEDKTWTRLRLTQFCPTLVQEQLATLTPEKQGDPATVLKMLLDQNKAPETNTRRATQPNDRDAGDEATEGTWEKKLGLSLTALKNMLKLCGIEKGEEDQFPSRVP